VIHGVEAGGLTPQSLVFDGNTAVLDDIDAFSRRFCPSLFVDDTRLHPDGVNFTAGSYKVAIKIFVKEEDEQKPTIKMIRIGNTVNDTFDMIHLDISDIAKNQWVTIEEVINVDNDFNSGNLRVYIYANDNVGVVGEQHFYMDDLSWTNIEERP